MFGDHADGGAVADKDDILVVGKLLRNALQHRLVARQHIIQGLAAFHPGAALAIAPATHGHHVRPMGILAAVHLPVTGENFVHAVDYVNALGKFRHTALLLKGACRQHRGLLSAQGNGAFKFHLALAHQLR